MRPMRGKKTARLALLLLVFSLTFVPGAPIRAETPAVGARPISSPSARTVVAASNWASCAARPAPLAAARSLDPEVANDLEKRVAAWQRARRSRIAGVSAAIRWDDGRTFEAAAGSADRGSGRAVTAGTPFALASVSKPFTATVALLLDACGILPLDTTAKSLVPKADVDPAATAEDLLRHESGMSDWLTDKSTRMDWLSKHPNANVGAMTAVQNLKPHGAIGSFDYSNSGYTLYTLMAERATGKPWKTLVQTLVLEPLGLDEISFGPIAAAARPHLWAKGGLRPWGTKGWGPTKSVAAVLRGAGDLFGTPRNLARFGALLWSNRLVEGPESLALNGIANITTNSWLYTYGTQVSRYWAGRLRVYGHSGGYSGVTTAVRRIPGLGITIAVTANGTEGSNSSADDLAKELFAILDAPSPDLTGAPRATAALTANADPLDVEPVIVGDGCGETSTAWVGGAKVENGEGWVALGATTGWSGTIDAMVELPDGRLVVAGRGLTKAAGVSVKGLAVRSPRTGAWTPLASLRNADGSTGYARALAVDSTHNLLYVGGDFVSIVSGGITTKARGIAVYDLAAKRWHALGSGLAATGGARPIVRSLSLQSLSGHLAVGGSFATAGGVRSKSVAVWEPTSGTSGKWRALVGGIDGSIDAVAIGLSGTVHVAGRLDGGYVARLTQGDSAWRIDADAASLGDSPRFLAVDSGGSAIVGTGVAWYGPALAIETNGWSPLGGGVAYPRRAAWISAMTRLNGGRIAIGGYFVAAGGAAARHLAIWNEGAGAFESLSAGLSIEPDALAASSTALLYAATRVRGSSAGSKGGRCMAAWAAPAPAAPRGGSVAPGRGSAVVRWGDPLTGTIPSGWIAVASAKGRPTRSCAAASTARTCTIQGLVKGVSYTVTLRAWVAPAGPSPSVSIGAVRPN